MVPSFAGGRRAATQGGQSLDDWVVELRGVTRQFITRQFGTVKAVDHIDLGIRRGEFFSLLGPSGCGKTTTLRLIAGFEEPDNGQVFINGEDVSVLPPFKRKVNTVFQRYALFPHLDVFENIAFGLRRSGTPDDVIEKKVRESLDLVRLTNMERRHVQSLSGGQQQRVALARALVNEPEVLLLDEPMAALDQKLRREMQFELKRIQKTTGITFILVTHDQEEALTMSDSVAVLNTGHVEQLGTPRDIYDQPSSRFVAEFMGTSNFLPVRVSCVKNGHTTVKLSDLEFLVPSRHGLKEGSSAEISIRPERLRLTREADASGNSMPGRVTDAVFMGACTRFTVEVDGKRLLTAEHQNLAHTPYPDFTPGDQVWVNWGHSSATLLPSSAISS